MHPYLTDKRPISRVDAGMSQQMVFQGEALLTFRALIRPETEDNREAVLVVCVTVNHANMTAAAPNSLAVT